MLRIGNYIITTPIIEILERIQLETGYRYLQDIKPSSNSIMVTCPFHGEHAESHPSCGICADESSQYYGIYHCFTCGAAGPLVNLVGTCFGQGGQYGEQWLIDNFGEVLYEEDEILTEIPLELPKAERTEKQYLDESILKQYEYFHPYMVKRKLTPEVIKRFHIGFDKETCSLTFPIWDWSGGLEAITRRSVVQKNFNLASGQSKSVYLLNFIREENLSYVYVAESQINALTLWSWGYPAVALLGTGSKTQYEILRKSGITSFIMCLDPDAAGRKGVNRFAKNMNLDALITVKDLPEGKDVNDLTKEEFDNSETLSYYDWKDKYK